MNVIEVASVGDFHAQIERTYTYHPIFRGESRSTYELRSKFGRAAKANQKNTSGCEQAIIEEFKRRAPPFLESEPKDDWEWLALAQHHGMSTRLLDWTKNPLVAAYFACNKPPFKGDAVIYALDEYSLSDRDAAASPFDIKTDCIYRPRHTAARIASQAGLFTVHSNPEQAFEPPALEKWLIKEAALVPLATLLFVYGVWRSHVFPGLDSVCSDIEQQYVWPEGSS